MENLNFLKKIELFNFLNDEQLSLISSLLKVYEFNDGDIIFEEGTMPDNLYLIFQGKTKIIKKIVDNETKVLATLNNGEFLDELSIFDNEPRSASVMAYGDDKIIIYSITREELIQLNYNHPDIMNVIMQNIIITLSKRMRKVNEQLRDKVFWGFVTKK